MEIFSPRSLGLLAVASILAFGNSPDLFLLLFFAAIKKWDTIQALTFFLNVNSSLLTTTLSVVLTVFICFQIYRYLNTLQQTSTPCHFPVKPMLFPCETAHQRLFPKRHAFAYSYLLVGIPVAWRGSVGGMISSETEKKATSWTSRLFSLKPRGAWYTVNGDDYLERGHVEGGLEEKLHRYLESQNVDPQQYTHVYLLTAARFLGYASNPVSIWHLYSSTKELKALVLEVNNTFDEKRTYFLEPAQSPSPCPQDGVSEVQKPPRYTGTWPKDFYVSTFNSRNGSYSLSASDPFFPYMTKAGPINTTITLNSSSCKPKLVARVYSAGPALDPTTMSAWAKTRFLASWWWVGLATFPRTVKEALNLLMRKGMPWVFRPEPRKETMARKADPLELMIEKHFRNYIRHQVVNSSSEPVSVRYIPAGLVGPAAREELMASPSADSDTPVEELRVLTPLFYSRLPQYEFIVGALLAEAASGTISLSPNLLQVLEFPAVSITANPSIQGNPDEVLRLSVIDLNFLAALRKRPAAIAIPEQERAAATKPPKLTGDPGLGSLDHFILSTVSTHEWRLYVKKVLKLMIAGRVALGMTELLDLEILVLRAGAAWGVVKLLLN
ncbi:uncharacterized protein L3040_005869 [Drepanopeziza brunnea f. sp. 'multigermtubi']|uniref:Cyclopropane-fatty-acyl-phospholipid synthase n=1 Tax=Marssonina brunnea f. sp. multigermtubi (strain MB_m1) TaxID=1072389 RepID=K1Y6U8_MARBU|nr:uncharacterized protein MBM_00047 [Drepanopeziza brunnea f. sp. 'multigermtubi' MB_m1]EKD20934.1 hypothetical protein MBM_00047 [Drepanopeziza brunnea f. sp. 'multigermtubi' MB_m1]KAJ5041324.1 hypothetical protein L3040_005869 [Drepanopeziza brunnea f. sp. 'multigermtubi']